MPNARKAALLVLDQIEKEGAYSNIALDNLFSRTPFSDTDRRFISALVYGVVDRKITLDYIISKYLKKGGKLNITVKNALRMAVYQITFMDKVPDFAAVNETVKIIKGTKYSYFSSLVNGVLRNVLRGDNTWPMGEGTSDLSVRFSCGEDIIKGLIADYGKETAVSVLENALEPPPIYIRVNTLKTNEEGLIKQLKEENTECEKTPLKNALIIKSGVNIAGLKAFKNGLFHIEDLACQTAVSKLELKKGERLLDTCSAPGGKAFTAAQYMENTGEIVACDLYPARLESVEEGANRLGIGIINTAAVDSTRFRDMGAFDAVLCDVPCSGIGVIRRKPEIKYKTNLKDEALTATQLKILETAAMHLKNGGRLMYSTCTLNKCENGDIVSKFLNTHKNYSLTYERTFLPHLDGTDGFYCALLTKSGE